MIQSRFRFFAVCLVLILLGSPAIQAQTQLSEAAAWAATLRYRVVPNVTYLVANNYEAKLDVYQPQGTPSTGTPTATVIYIHGVGWVGVTKEGSLLNIFPYLEMGWAVVNVGYRMARVSLAPAGLSRTAAALWPGSSGMQKSTTSTRAGSWSPDIPRWCTCP